MGYFDVKVDECAYMCDLMSGCIGFEYYNTETNSRELQGEEFKPCRLKYGGLSTESECSENFTTSNLAYYYKDPDGFLKVGNTMCGGGKAWLTDTLTYAFNVSTNVTWDRTIFGCATLCDTIGKDKCTTFWVHGEFPLYDVCAMFSNAGVSFGGTNTLCYKRSGSHAELQLKPAHSIAGEDEDILFWGVEDSCTNGWFAKMPQYTDGHNLCQYSCEGRRRIANKSLGLVMDNVRAHTTNRTYSGLMNLNPSFTESSLTARRLTVGTLFKGLAQLLTIISSAVRIENPSTSSSDTDLDSRLCTSDSVLECLGWATCVTCGILFSIGKNLSSIETCKTTSFNIMEKYKGNPSCLNLACEGVVVENDRLVYDCANPVFDRCLSLYTEELNGDDDSEDDNGCC